MKKLCIALFLALALVFPACSSGQKGPLKVGVIPMMTTLPLYVADQEGLFKKQGVAVEIVPFRSVMDRDTALAAGQLDGIIEDIFSAPLLDKEKPLVKVVAVSPVERAMFYIIASPQSDERTAADLKGSDVALSLNTITEYALDKLVEAGGLQRSDVNKVSVPSMPLRLEMLDQGKVSAAVLSRPLADVALAHGARVIASDLLMPLSTSSIMFSSATLKARPDAVQKFLAAWSQAIGEIGGAPQKYRSVLIQAAQVPDEVAAGIDMPRFSEMRMPTPEELQTKVDWLLQKGILSKSIAYEDVVARLPLAK